MTTTEIEKFVEEGEKECFSSSASLREFFNFICCFLLSSFHYLYDHTSSFYAGLMTVCEVFPQTLRQQTK